MKSKTLHSSCRSAVPAITAALAAVGLIGSARAAIQNAGDILVNVDATALPDGPLASIANTGTMGGVFEAGGSGATIAPVYGAGTTKGMRFDGGGVFLHKDMVGGVLKSADPGLTGVNPTTSIEAWVLNPSIPGEETIVAWGHRGPGTADGSNMSFNYGYDSRWGAVGHWGNPDIGWDGNVPHNPPYGGSPPGTPAAGQWHHLVYTFDGTTQRVYADGVLKNSEAVSLNTLPVPAIAIGGQLLDDASNVEPGLRASMTIGRIRIHQEALTPAQVANNYNFEKGDFTGAASFVNAAPIHRYRFANAAGPAPDESPVTDSIGTAHGTVQGAGANFTGTRVTIPGGSSASEAYIDLPNNLLSVNSSDSGGSGQITLEGWTKVTGTRQWSRILDFGSSDVADPGLIGGEVFGPGGGGEGLDYLFYDASENFNNNQRNVVVRNIDPLPAGVGGVGPEQGTAFNTPNFQMDFHWAITWDENGGVVRVYENGNEVGSYGIDNVANRFSKLNDLNVWLGRSNWTGDQNMQGEFDEFRIYNKVLTGEEVARNTVAGPAQLHLPGQSPAFDKQPSNVTVQEQLTATFSVETRGQSPMTFQWFRGANPIPGATGQSFSLLASAGDNGAQFKCRAENALGALESSVAQLNVIADTTPPTLVGAAGGTAWGLDDTHFGIRFSEPINTADATTLANYTVSGITLVPGLLSLLPDNVTVVGFTTATSLRAAGCKSITVTGVIRDRSPSGNPVAVPATAGIVYAEGTARYHQYNDNFNSVSVNALRSNPNFPDKPDVIAYKPAIEGPDSDGGDNFNDYGAQIIALISPPATGAYRFFVAADDNAELYLSTDENPANKVLIAREPVWANFREWTGNAPGQGGRPTCQTVSGTLLCENVSAPINLSAGCRYYVELLFKEDGGGDYGSVNWQLPGAPLPANGTPPIGSQYISPFESAPAIPSGQPADQTLDEGRRATLTANITGSPLLTIQWYKGSDPIPGANSRTYVTDPLVFPADNGATFRVEAMNSLGTAVSRTAAITVIEDTIPPLVLKSLGGPLLDVFTLKFNEILNKTSAEDAFNFTINGVNPGSAVLSADGTVVTLTFGPQTPNTLYAVTIDNVQDFSLNTMPHTDLMIRSAVQGCGGVNFQAFLGIGGNAVADLVNHANFPNNPQVVGTVPTFDSTGQPGFGANAVEGYGGRLRGLFIPPASGNWVFYVRSDDASELHLNPNGASPAGKVKIAEETGCCAAFEAHTSTPIPLVAGEAYYLECLYKEGTGGDYGQVAARLEGSADALAPIQGNLLGQFAPLNVIGPVTLAPALPADVSAIGGAVVSFSVTATAPTDYAPVCYQWERDDGSGFQPIATANGPTYSFGPVVLADNGAKFRCVVSSIGTVVPSREALLNVSVDTTPPTVLNIRFLPDLTRLDIRFSEFVEMTTAQDPFNYTVDGVNPPSAVLLPDGMTVRLTLAGPVTPETQSCIAVQNVTDLAANTLNPNPTTRCIDTPRFSCGLLRFEAWNNITGTAIDGLLNDPRYPDSPDETRIFGSFDTVTELGTINYRDNYGARVVGLFVPPTSGNWVFYLASDDASRLYLNPNGTEPAGKQMIAEETGCCQNINAIRSAPIPLTGGARYYIEGVYKEAGGNDHIYVAARLDGQPAPNCVAFAQCADALRGESVGVYADGNGVSLDITTQPQDQKVCRDPNVATPPTATFTVAATALQGTAPSSLQSQDFNANNGGCTVENLGAPFEGPWTYDAAAGSWKSDGQGPELQRPTSTRLTCPAVTVTRPGAVGLTFVHRWSFESGSWDGGQVLISKNGGAFTAVSGSAFTANGYNGTVLGNSAAELHGQAAFVETSAGHSTPAFITSVADLGNYVPGDTIRIQFLAANDTNTRNLRPQWEVTSLSLTEGAGGAALPVVIQWQRNNGGGYVDIPFARSASYSFVPVLADNGTRFRALVATPGVACQHSGEALLTVIQINTPPRVTCGPDQSVPCNAGAQSVPGWASGISAHSIVRVPTVYANNFNAGAAGMTLAGTPIAVIQDGVLKLTTPVNSAYGAASIAAPVQTYESLTVTWKSLLGGGGGGGADGYSVSIGEDVVADPGYGGEEGTGTGLIVAVDTFDNGAALDPCTTGIELKWRGTPVTCLTIPKDNPGDGRFLRKSQLVDASVTVDATGLATFTYDGNVISGQLPAYAGVRASRVLFWARTGGANDNQWIDDFTLQAFPFDASSAEANQTVKFLVSNDNPSLFSQQPAISPDGTLTYTPAPGACGTARVTVVAMDNGGTDPQCGGRDMSDPCSFNIALGVCPPVLTCPASVRNTDQCTSNNCAPVTYTVMARDCAGNALPVTCVPPSGTCFPEGTTPVTCTATDSGGRSSTCTFPVIVECRCPVVAVAKASPNAELRPNQTSTIVISVNNSNACVTLDGSMSTDPGGNPLTYVWLADLDGNGTKEPFASGAVVTNCFELGEHDIMLMVDNGRCSTTTSLTVEVLTAGEAIELLIEKIDNADLGRRNKRPLIATLKAAIASFDRGSCGSGVNQLEAFQNKVRAQVGHEDASLADDIIACAQEILDAIECE